MRQELQSLGVAKLRRSKNGDSSARDPRTVTPGFCTAQKPNHAATVLLSHSKKPPMPASGSCCSVVPVVNVTLDISALFTEHAMAYVHKSNGHRHGRIRNENIDSEDRNGSPYGLLVRKARQPGNVEAVYLKNLIDTIRPTTVQMESSPSQPSSI